MTSDNSTKNRTPDPNTKTRLIVGGVLLALAWLLSAATVAGLLFVLPEQHVRDYAWAVIGTGVLTAAGATYALIGLMARR